MIELYDFNKCEQSNRDYGGNSGLKLGIIFNGEPWLLKFPKSTFGFRNVEISYTTSPISEYVGSKVYEILGIPVHETLLGSYNGKVVVACKDMVPTGGRLQEFSELKNRYSPELEAYLTSASSSDSHGIALEMIEKMFVLNQSLKNIEGLEAHFWDMFVVDAFIGNPDRNNGNWGVLYTGNGSVISPVYDNGNAFRNKASDRQLQKTIQNEEALKDSAYRIQSCFFEDENGKKINPNNYISELKNPKCADAVRRIVPRIRLGEIEKMIREIPEKWNGLSVVSDIAKEYMYRVMETRYSDILYPTFARCIAAKSKSVPEKTAEAILTREQMSKTKKR